jgi:hypothetical protein
VAVTMTGLLIVPYLGYGWHLLHGNFILFAGWRIPVPSGYYVTREAKGPGIWRLSLGAPYVEGPFGHFSFHQSERIFLAGNDYAFFEKAMNEDAVASGYQLESRETVPAGGNSAYCVVFARAAIQPRSIARCAIGNTRIYVFYEGDGRYLPDLRGVLQGMTSENGTSSAALK